MAAIGLIPDNDFYPDQLDPAILSTIEHVPKPALQKNLAYDKIRGNEKNGWIFYMNLGPYGTNYVQRAYTAYVGLGAKLPEDAIYPYTTVDNQRRPLTGFHKYIIHFTKDNLPPVHAF